MDLDAYVTEHSPQWRRLEQLSTSRRLNADEIDELIALYQRSATHLSVIRSRQPDPALVARLSRLVLGARSAITGGSTFSARTVGRFFTVTFPLAAYRGIRWWGGVTAAFTAVASCLIWYVAGHPEVAGMFLSQRRIDQIVESGFVSYYSEYQAQNFALEVWSNNAFVAVRCLAAGVLLVPVVVILWDNVFNLGLTGGIMFGHGRGDVFLVMIAPHGLLELTCVFIAAGFGLRIGWSWISPGQHRSRGRALAETAREAMLVALGLVLVLMVCGVLEAFVTPSGLPAAARVGIGGGVLVAFLVYVVVAGRRAAAAGQVTDVDPTAGRDRLPTA